MDREKKMATGYDKDRIRNNMNKRGRIPESKGRNSKLLVSARSHEHLNNIRKCPILWTCESRVVRSDLMSVCVKRKVLVHNNNISNENMITEMKDNKIINAKNKI